MRKSLWIGLILCSGVAAGQSRVSLTRTIQNLYKAGSNPDSVARKREVIQRWAKVRALGIPLVSKDSAAFLYRGEANSVAWMGDFNGWGYYKEIRNKGVRIPGTDVWVLRCSFPKDARLDYKIVLNETSWILDPENPHQQWSGVGGGSPNSEIRMPQWREDPIQRKRENIPRGSVITDVLFDSKILGYQVTYSVYLPAGFEKLGKLPVIYTTDGNEYMMPQLGNMISTLDNLIADKKIVPIIAIFVDHREPINRANNRRMDEMMMNEKYRSFFTEEFIPAVENQYPIQSDRTHRAILGTSLGGLTSAYFAFSRPDLFGMAGIQSPAFRIRPQIYTLCNSAEPRAKVFLTTGLIYDAAAESRRMKDTLQSKAYVFRYRENNESHSWGNWKGLIDDILVDFFANNK